MTIPTNPGFVVGRFHSSFNPNSENPLLLLQPHVQRPEKKKDLAPVRPLTWLSRTHSCESAQKLGVPPNLSSPHLPSRVPTYHNPYRLHILLTQLSRP